MADEASPMNWSLDLKVESVGKVIQWIKNKAKSRTEKCAVFRTRACLSLPCIRQARTMS